MYHIVWLYQFKDFSLASFNNLLPQSSVFGMAILKKKFTPLGCLHNVSKISLFVAKSTAKYFTTYFPSFESWLRLTLVDFGIFNFILGFTSKLTLLLHHVPNTTRNTHEDRHPQMILVTEVVWGSLAFGLLKVLPLAKSTTSS
jgi:hypothetical protein